MTHTEPKYRRPLNEEQLDVLQLLYRFRFITAELLAKYQDRADGAAVYNRLKVLCDQEYIGRNIDPTNRFRNPASYFLLPRALKILQEYPECDPDVLHNIYNDKRASQQFIGHSLNTLQTYVRLRALYGNHMDFHTKSEMAGYSYFPKPPPDAYISLRMSCGSHTRHYILFVCEEATRPFVYVKRAEQAIRYYRETIADKKISQCPTILMLCETIRQRNKLQPDIAKAVSNTTDIRLKLYMTTRELMTVMNNTDSALWQLSTDPITMRSLKDM